MIVFIITYIQIQPIKKKKYVQGNVECVRILIEAGADIDNKETIWT